jgi:hypothetical protein
MIHIFNCNWVDTRWKYYSTHLHTISTQNTENGTYITINRKICIFGKYGPCPVFASYTLAFALKLRKRHRKTSVRAAARTTQADTVQYKNNEQYDTQKKNSNTELAEQHILLSSVDRTSISLFIFSTYLVASQVFT